MTGSITLRTLLATSIGIGSVTTALSQVLVPKFTASTNSLYPGSIQQEVHLARALLLETNRGFDEKLHRSLGAATKAPAVISFHLVTFVFSYPTTNDCAASSCEMGQTDELICTGESVSRRGGSTNEIPLNYVRIVDRRKKEVTAELDLLLGEAPLTDPKNIQYFRRSFRFVYRDGWKED